MTTDFVNHAELKKAHDGVLEAIIVDGGPTDLVDAARRELRRRRELRHRDEDDLEIGGAFDGFTVTSDADPGL